MKKTGKPNRKDEVRDLEIALDIIREVAIEMRPGSLPHIQLHKMVAVLSLVIDVVKFERSLKTSWTLN